MMHGISNNKITTVIFKLLQFPGIMLIYFIFLESCSGLKGLTDDQKLYTGGSVQFADEKITGKPKELRKELDKLLTPKPNKKFLGMRTSLWIYNHTGEPKHKKGIRYWWKYKVGRPPVLFDENIVRNNLLLLNNNLYYRGYFGAGTTYKLIEKGKTTFVNYFITTGRPFIIDSVAFPGDETRVEAEITKTRTETLLKPGSPYNLKTLKKERKRIQMQLKDEGYYYFDDDFLIYRIDSTLGNHKIRLYLHIKPRIPEKSLKPYRIRKVRIIDDFNQYIPYYDSANINGYEYLSNTHYIRPKIVIDMLSVKPGMLYSRSEHITTISRLERMSTFRFVTINYRPVAESDSLLDATILLAPARKLSLNSEVSAIAKTNNFFGPGLKVTFKSRNFFKGAEMFTTNLHGRFETQIAGNDKGNTAYEFGGDLNLIIPRVIPFRMVRYKGRFMPYTKATLGYSVFQRLKLYQFNTSYASWSYKWKKTIPSNHEIKLIDVSFTNLTEATAEFQEWLKNNPSLRKSFEEQFIISTTYSYTYNHLEDEYRRKYFFRFTVDPSGNLATALLSMGKKEKPSPDNPYKIFGNPVSQFFRGTTEGRYYIKTGKKSVVATRLLIGLGIPYGNSSTIPYVRQFYVGGTNSLRGFPARSIGPGIYVPPDSLAGLNIVQTGDVKIEANVEYRFPITKHLKGALFVDVGNVWTVYEDTARVGSQFDFNTFYKELAVSSGFGLRIDLNMVILRFDVGFPLRKPWLPEGDRWVGGDFNPFNKEWRKKNLILNFSVGYPF